MIDFLPESFAGLVVCGSDCRDSRRTSSSEQGTECSYVLVRPFENPIMHFCLGRGHSLLALTHLRQRPTMTVRPRISQLALTPLINVRSYFHLFPYNISTILPPPANSDSNRRRTRRVRSRLRLSTHRRTNPTPNSTSTHYRRTIV